MQRTNRGQSPDTSRRGAALVEFAVVAPVLFMVVLGICEFGRAFLAAQQITNTAREAARMAIIDGTTNADVTTYVQNTLTSAFAIAPEDITTTYLVTQYEDESTSTNIADAGVRDLISVDVAVPFVELSWTSPRWLTGSNLRGGASMRKD